MNTNRLETFADGVFAIAATLLILNVDAQVSEDERELGERLLEIWPSYAAYAVTFFTIGIVWVNHHTVMSQIDRADRVFLFLNIGFLMFGAFAPFPTRLIAEHIREEGARAATLTYGITLVLMAVVFNALWLYASVGARLLRADYDPKVVRGITRSYALGPAIYLVATLISIVSPTVGVILFAAIAALYILESSLFGRTKQRE
jgi:uncharacterized membrane protein